MKDIWILTPLIEYFKHTDKLFSYRSKSLTATIHLTLFKLVQYNINSYVKSYRVLRCAWIWIHYLLAYQITFLCVCRRLMFHFRHLPPTRWGKPCNFIDDTRVSDSPRLHNLWKYRHTAALRVKVVRFMYMK